MLDEQMNIVIVGHVDHGKSTIIGRLLADTGSLPQGKLETIKRFCELNSKPFEYAFLLDSLGDERAQGITIDIARCFFSTKKRKYLLLDAPGHIEFMKNLVTGAAAAEAAFLVIDAEEGVQENTRRHAYMLSLLNIKQVVILVNKIDLIHYDEMQFNELRHAFSVYLKQINIEPCSYIPVSGRNGDNIIERSEKMPWYQGDTVLDRLDLFQKQAVDNELPFRMHLQDVYKFTNNGDNRRIFAGLVSSGQLNVGDCVIFSPSGKTSKVKTIEVFNAPSALKVTAGYSTGFTLHEQIYVKRGDVVSLATESKPLTASTLIVSLFWLGLKPLCLKKSYWFKLGTSKTRVIIEQITHVIDTASFEIRKSADQVLTNQAAECQIKLAHPIAFDNNVDANMAMKRFVIVDEFDIAGGGIILSHCDDDKIERQKQGFKQSHIGYQKRCEHYQQAGQIIWFTGLSGSGKTTLATLLELKLIQAGKVTCLLDGDSLRDGLNSDLGFSDEARHENIRRIGELATYLARQALIVIVSAISPHRIMRERAREKATVARVDFSEIYVNASIDTCRERDPKGLYKKVENGTLHEFTGIDACYEPPCCPDVILDTEKQDVNACMDILLMKLNMSLNEC